MSQMILPASESFLNDPFRHMQDPNWFASHIDDESKQGDDVLNLKYNGYFMKFVRQQIESNFDFTLIYKSIRKDETQQKFNARKFIAIWLLNRGYDNPSTYLIPCKFDIFYEKITNIFFKANRISLRNLDDDTMVNMIKALGRRSADQVKDQIFFHFPWWDLVKKHGYVSLSLCQKLEIIERFPNNEHDLVKMFEI
jgi:hypothetical protein